jgi:hypothetical protein
MVSRRRMLKFLCLGAVAGCVTPRRNWADRPDFLADDSGRENKDAHLKPNTPAPDKLVYSGAGNVRVLPRWKWTNAPELKWRLEPMGRIWRITVHHEGNPEPNTAESYAAVANNLRLIRRTHLRVMRAGDIGYHYIIDRAGRIWQGRPAKYQGAHAGGNANRGNVGVMLLGNFDIQHPTARQKTMLGKFLRHLMSTYRISSRRVYTHRELKVTRCPGTHLQRHMNALRRRL